MTTSPQWPLIPNQQSTPQQYPSVGESIITELQRDQAERMLHQAHRDGRITTTDFEQRFTTAMNASQLSQLSAAISNIPAPVAQAMVRMHDQYRGHRSEQAIAVPDPQQNPNVAMLAHLSGLVAGPVGPGISYALSRPGSKLRLEAAKAFNFQLSALVVLVASGVVFGVLGLGAAMGLIWTAWAALTVMGAVVAGRGQDWRNPVHNFIKIEPLPTDGR